MTPRKPTRPADDQPFDFNLDAVEAEVDLTPWRVNYGGKRWTFAHPQSVDVWNVVDWDESSGESSEMSSMIGVFKAALGEQFPEFRKIPLPAFKLKRLFEEYQQYGGAELGESQGSDDS